VTDATICVFAKPPVPGKAKTRLIPAFGAEMAARCAEAFLLDTVESVEKLGWAKLIIAATEPFSHPAIADHELWLQPEGGLDVRIEAILRRALMSSPMAFALGADSPGLPVQLLEDARKTLATQDAVLGPTMDGGFYLLGVKQCPEGMLNEIQWSHASTLQQTLRRLRYLGLSVVQTGEWLDVDVPEDLAKLKDVLGRHGATAIHTRSLAGALTAGARTAR
jgi:uncharacterized protein